MAGFMYHLRAADGRHFNRREAAQWRRTKTIHIQDPKVDARYFDLLITPRHDDIAADGDLRSRGVSNVLAQQVR